jgi:glycosyltransferase involved in cell wall biosynthesis
MRISAVIPIYNSEVTIPELHRRVTSALSGVAGEDHQIVFVNDGSRDGSWAALKALADSDPRVVAVDLLRNFGQHNALMCGFKIAEGDYIVTLDDDLQNPPEEIPAMFEALTSRGLDVLYGIPKGKRHSPFRNLGSAAVQLSYRKTFKVAAKLSSFRIMRKEIVRHILSYEKSFTFIDGVIAWFTSRIGNIDVAHERRAVGRSGYSFAKLFALAINMATNFSLGPLQVASLMGTLFSLAGFAAAAFFLAKKLIFDIPVTGYTSLIVAITIFVGVQLLTIGLLGEYVGRVHINVSRRPQYAVREVVGKGGGSIT